MEIFYLASDKRLFTMILTDSVAYLEVTKPAPPPLGNGLRPSLLVILANANCDRVTVKYGTQNIQNDCHEWISGSFRVHQIRFRPGLCPDPIGRLTALPQTP